MRRTLAVLVVALAAMCGGAGASTAGAATITGFQMPSGNIACQGYAGVVRCDIRRTSNPQPARPKNCELDYGSAFAVSRNSKKGSRICVGDTVLDPRLHKLAYGRSWRYRGVTCTSSPSALTCTNHLRHGFRLARAHQEVF